MPHAIEPASSGRASCRGCGVRIPAGVLRFGERLPNPFGEGDTTHWFHLDCAAFKRPEPFLEALEGAAQPPEGAELLAAEARRGAAHRRLHRINGAERSPSARARCRSCHANIEKGSWRIPLLFYEEGRFSPSGFIHVTCALAYFGTSDVLPRLRRFAPDLRAEDLAALEAELAKAGTGADPGEPGP